MDYTELKALECELHDAAVERMGYFERAMAAKDIDMQCGVELDVFFKKNGWSITTVDQRDVEKMLKKLPCFEAFARQADMFKAPIKLLHGLPLIPMCFEGVHTLPCSLGLYTPMLMGLQRLTRVPMSHYQVKFNNTVQGDAKSLLQLADDVEESRHVLARFAAKHRVGKAEFNGGRYKEKLMAFTAPSMHLNSSVWRQKDKPLMSEPAVFDACADTSLIMQREAALLKLSTPESYHNIHMESCYTRTVDVNKKISSFTDQLRSLRARGEKHSPYLEDRLSMADCNAHLAVASAAGGMYAGLVHAGLIDDPNVARAARESVAMLHHSEPNRLHELGIPRTIAEARKRYEEGALTKAVLGERLYHAAGRYYDAVIAMQEKVGAGVV